MKITDAVVFNGRNIYSHKKCIRIDLDLEGYSEIPSNKIPEFNAKIVKAVPELMKHGCAYEMEGGFLKRLEEGTYLSHICEHVTIALQNRIGLDVKYGKAREVAGEHYYFAFQYEYKNTGLECAKTAVDIINSLIDRSDFNLDLRLREIRNILNSEKLGISTSCIINEAKKREIPTMLIGDSFVQLGYGKSSFTMEGTISSNTNAIAVDISCDKLITKEILKAQCLPVPDGNKVCNPLDLIFEGKEIGYPVVLKPRYGNHGKGVMANIKNERELILSYETLSKNYKDILIEKHVEGNDYRVCMVNGKYICAAIRIPPFVVGDGVRSIKELIEEINQSSNRGEGHENRLTKIVIDSELERCIREKGCYTNSVLPEGEKVLLRRNSNISTGGIGGDCSNEICSENIEICERAAKAIGLDICGIDICCKDIRKPMEGTDAIIEINASPGIRMHHYPSFGESHNVAGEILDMIFKEKNKSIPIVSVTGTNGKTTTTRIIGFALSLAGYNVGMTTTGGIYINGKCISTGDTTGPRSAMTVLRNKEVEAAVLETARGGIIREGLAYDLADVGVITNITEDHLGIDGIETLEELAKVKALVGEAVKEKGYTVLNADDDISKTIISRIKSKIIFFSKNNNNPLLKEAVLSGGMAVYAKDNCIYRENKAGKIPVVMVDDISITLKGNLIYNVENAMAAISALIGLNISTNIIAEALIKFKGDKEQNPGRFNIYDIGNAMIILDYGHNIEGYRAVIKGATKIGHKRLVGIIGIPGDRLNSNVIEVGKIAGESFDYLYVKEDQDRRGRKRGEIADLLKEGVYKSSMNRKNVNIILDEKDALKEAIRNSQSGDVILVFFEKYEPLVEIVEQVIKGASAEKKEVSLA